MLRDFRLNLIIRVAILLLLVTASVLAMTRGYLLTGGFLLLLLAGLVANLIHFVNKTNRDLANFLAGVEHDDFTSTGISHDEHSSFGELHRSFHLINRKFRDIRAEKEANHQFLHTIVKYIDIGLMSIDADGKVILMNRALQRMLHRSYLMDLDSLREVDETLWKTISRLKGGEKQLVKVNIDNSLLQLAVQSIDLKLQQESFRLITLQNIQSELEEQELKAWQKLIRILTHEIMNSVAPITSLTATISQMLNGSKDLKESELEQIVDSLAVIERRSEGLLHFTETYRRLTRIPPPKFRPVNTAAMAKRLQTLFRQELQDKGIDFRLHLQPGEMVFEADPDLIEQVLINLIRNAVDAVEHREDPVVELRIQSSNNHKVLIQVSDNGIGMEEGVLDQVFVPFFTTKDNGSGIGLSLSRQIVRLHKGKIELQSAAGKGTVVSLIL